MAAAMLHRREPGPSGQQGCDPHLQAHRLSCPAVNCTHHAAVGALQRVQALRCGCRLSTPHAELASGASQAGLDGGNCSAGEEIVCGRDDSNFFRQTWLASEPRDSSITRARAQPSQVKAADVQIDANEGSLWPWMPEMRAWVAATWASTSAPLRLLGGRRRGTSTHTRCSNGGLHVKHTSRSSGCPCAHTARSPKSTNRPPARAAAAGRPVT